MKRLQRAADRLRVNPDLLVKAAVRRFIRLPKSKQIEGVKEFLKALNARN